MSCYNTRSMSVKKIDISKIAAGPVGCDETDPNYSPSSTDESSLSLSMSLSRTDSESESGDGSESEESSNAVSSEFESASSSSEFADADDANDSDSDSDSGSAKDEDKDRDYDDIVEKQTENILNIIGLVTDKLTRKRKSGINCVEGDATSSDDESYSSQDCNYYERIESKPSKTQKVSNTSEKPDSIAASVKKNRVQKADSKAESKCEIVVKTNPGLPKYNSEERRYFKKAIISEERATISEIEKKIFNLTDGNIPLRFKILNSKIDIHTKSLAIKKLNMLNDVSEGSGEYFKHMQWINAVCNMPIGKYIEMPQLNSNREEIKSFLQNTKAIFDREVYGHVDTKDQMIRIIAQWLANPTSKGNVIGIHGSPGVGKTTLVQNGICKALNLPFQFIPLGGANDGSYLDGHSFTYEGAVWGKIIDSVFKAKCMNPVLYFDELDKVSDSSRGDEVINTLIHLTDPAQNSAFNDKYFQDISFDLSKCLIVFTYNDDSKVNPILKDRMIRIHANDYNVNDKIKLSHEHLIPSLLNQFGKEKEDIVFTDDIIKCVVSNAAPEAGVRNLKRAFETIIGTYNLKSLIGEISLPVTVTKESVEKALRKSKVNNVNDSLPHMYI